MLPVPCAAPYHQSKFLVFVTQIGKKAFSDLNSAICSIYRVVFKLVNFCFISPPSAGSHSQIGLWSCSSLSLRKMIKIKRLADSLKQMPDCFAEMNKNSSMFSSCPSLLCSLFSSDTLTNPRPSLHILHFWFYDFLL